MEVEHPERPENPEHVENPPTAIISETESEPPSQRHTPKHKKKKRRRFRPNYDIPGVHKLILPELTQKIIGCIVGDTVTAEKPWTNVEKELITEHLDMHAESSEFLPVRNELLNCPMNEILMGYIPDESKEYDEFYVCVTEEATENINRVVEKVRRIQEERLNNAIHKKIKAWKPLGSDKEVEEAMVKTHRSLIEVEIESKYPILPFKVHFRLVKAEDLRDGYMELNSTDEALSTIFRRRVDAFVQVAPSVLTNEAQTVCTYPRNSYTQYDYKIPEVDWRDSTMKDFIQENMDGFCDILRVNGCIDLYSNDYEKLVLDTKYASKVIVPEYKDYYCFIDMNLCGNKMISGTCWHPMWTGCVMLSYVDVAPSFYLTSKITTDEVFKAVHDTHPVLFWSFTDDLKPKLILETPRPVYTLHCCPFDPNLIVGGCSNGQIILWDITNKLIHVEEEEILTINQQKYREYMFSLMKWMKNTFDLALVRPAALSDLKYSHRGCINYITWMSPFHNISKTGKVEEIEEGASHSLELITSAEDGTIMIWDLLRKPTVEHGGFKAVRKMKRLKKRPSALSVMESPFKILHLNLKPVYKINIINPLDNRLLGISSCKMKFFETMYETSTKDSTKNVKLSDRIYYSPVLNKQNSRTRTTFYVGTMEGEFLQGKWDGQDFDSGEVVNFEDCGYINSGRYHDGPVVCVDYAATLDTVLTVGGKVFALWREPFKNRPLLWRKSTNIYTYGSWFVFDQASIKLTRIDGYHETWTLFYQSKTPTSIILRSNGAISNATVHPRKLKSRILGLSDYRGSFRIFYNKNENPVFVKAKEENMSAFITREIERKKAFLKWQSEWNERRKAAPEVVEEEEKPFVIDEQKKTKKKEEKKKLPVTKLTPGERYLEIMQEQQKANAQARIKSIILIKKQLDTEDLLKKSEPLRKLEEENEIKKRKQKLKLKQSDKIFKDQVSMFFPDVVKVKPPPPPDPYEDCYSAETKKLNFDNYHEIAISAQDYVEENPFSYDFSWTTVLKAGRERRKKLDDSPDKDNHRLRYASVKEEKTRQLAAAEAAEAAEAEAARRPLVHEEEEESIVSSP